MMFERVKGAVFQRLFCFMIVVIPRVCGKKSINIAIILADKFGKEY